MASKTESRQRKSAPAKARESKGSNDSMDLSIFKPYEVSFNPTEKVDDRYMASARLPFGATVLDRESYEDDDGSTMERPTESEPGETMTRYGASAAEADEALQRDVFRRMVRQYGDPRMEEGAEFNPQPDEPVRIESPEDDKGDVNVVTQNADGTESGSADDKPSD